MAFTRWVRSVSEKELLVAAQRKIAKRYGIPAPAVPRGVDVFWQRVYAPAFYRLPVRLRTRVVHAMPGSHRKQWTPRPPSQGPAV